MSELIMNQMERIQAVDTATTGGIVVLSNKVLFHDF